MDGYKLESTKGTDHPKWVKILLVQYMDGYKLSPQSGRVIKKVNKSPIADGYKLMFNKLGGLPLKLNPWWTVT